MTFIRIACWSDGSENLFIVNLRKNRRIEKGSIHNLLMNFVVKFEEWGSSWRRVWDLESFCSMVDITVCLLMRLIQRENIYVCG